MNFKYLDDLIQSGVKEIVLDSDIVLKSSEKSKYLEGILIDCNSLVIDGKGHTIDARGKTRIFKINGGNITLKNITLKRGHSKEDGGVIYNGGSLKCIESTFESNFSKSNGGAIYNAGTLLVIDSYFKSNSSNNNSFKMFFSSEGGGAIYNEGSLKCIGSTFESNSTMCNGGAVYDCGALSVIDSYFKSNSSSKSLLSNDGGGGAIYTTGNIDIVNSNFEANKTRNRGGAINAIKDLTVTDSNFKSNVATSGGAIFNEGSLTVDGSKFVANKTTDVIFHYYGGGAIYCRYLTVKKSYFEKNSTLNWGGGAISVAGEFDEHTSIYLNVEESIFKNNSAIKCGGAIFSRGSGRVNIVKSSFCDNNSKRYGGAIYGGGNISESTFKHNKAIWGGAISTLYYRGSININNCNLSNNVSRISGGAVHIKKGNLNVVDSKFYGNNSFKGGVIYNKKAECNIENSHFVSNSSKLSGGVITNSSNTFNISRSRFSKNSSRSSIIINGDDLRIYNTIFEGNNSKNILVNEKSDRASLGIFGGEFLGNNINESVINNNGSSCSVNKAKFENNLLHNKNAYNIKNQTYLNLISPKMENDDESILNNGFINVKRVQEDFENQIQGSGVGGVDFHREDENFDFTYLDEKIHDGEKEITLNQDIVLQYYERDFYEGGIELDIDDLVIDGNGMIIDAGGLSRIFMIYANNVTLKNITFRNGKTIFSHENRCNNAGGSIKVCRDSSLKLVNCNFINSISNRSAGAIYNAGNTAIEGCKFENNSSKHLGGSIYNIGELNVLDSSFMSNKTKIGGGAIYNVNMMEIMNSSFKSNTGNIGGAIYDSGKNMVIGGSFFSNNLSNNHGGALFISDAGKVNIQNSKFIKNKSKGKGGAIWHHYFGPELDVDTCTFQFNLPTSVSNKGMGEFSMLIIRLINKIGLKDMENEMWYLE